MAQQRSPLTLSLGTMTFGWERSSTFLDPAACEEMTNTFVAAGHRELDTALMYSEGESEKIIGNMLTKSPELASACGIATKANAVGSASLKAVMGGAPATGGLAPAKLRAQLEESLASLKLDSVELFYLHMPDHGTPIADTLQALNELHSEGKFQEWGLSNFTAWETVHIWHLCQQNGWVKPTVYQAMYNAVTRSIEDELIPACHYLGIRIRIYNPLAGGMLTGKHQALKESGPAEGRFKDNPAYQNRFWKDSFFAAMDVVQEACEKEGVSMTEAAMRWVTCHSLLSSEKGDGIILGASSMAHLTANLAACANTNPLPESVLEAYDKAWELSKKDCPSFSRGTSLLA